MTTVFYCGVWPNDRDNVGHFIYPPSGWPSWLDSRSRKAQEHGCPFDDLDSDTYLPKPRTQGLAKLTHVTKGGKRWTVIAIHDQTGDDRPGSHSTFAIEGELAFGEAIGVARRWFPAVLERLQAANVRVVEWTSG